MTPGAHVDIRCDVDITFGSQFSSACGCRVFHVSVMLCTSALLSLRLPGDSLAWTSRPAVEISGLQVHAAEFDFLHGFWGSHLCHQARTTSTLSVTESSHRPETNHSSSLKKKRRSRFSPTRRTCPMGNLDTCSRHILYEQAWLGCCAPPDTHSFHS